ncbi:TnpV protein [Clostridium sp. Marseille-P2415]|uniref:TnpV protein n=1 Tax=Clostridium sp. Marseille-P2415 TaxID=1805471 RepID=UPI0009885CDF|nr:TnpV protein [Clostridium sp. Marseille-P2415]
MENKIFMSVQEVADELGVSKLNEYLHGVDVECYEMEELLIEQMKKVQGVTEQLKAENQMLWVGRMNNIRSLAEEVVLRELVYC